MKRKRTGLLSMSALAVLIAVIAAGCGGGSGNTTTAQSSSTSAGSSTALAQFQTVLKQAYAGFHPKKFLGPTTPISPPKNISLTIIECTAALAGCSEPAKGAAQAAAALGWKYDLVDGQGNTARYNTLMLNAVSNGANAIIAVGISAKSISQGLKVAHAHNVTVMSLSQESAISKSGFQFDVSGDQRLLGKYDAAYVAVHSQGKAVVLPMMDNEYPSTVHFVDGFLNEIKKCTTCTIEPTMNFISADISTTLPTRLTGYLSSHPSVKWILGPFDPVVTLAICPALQKMGLAKKVNVVSVHGQPSNVALVAKGECEVADGAWPQQWNGWAGVDQLIRLLNHQPTFKPADENMPHALIDKNHIPANDQYAGGINFRAEYEKTWGVTK